MVLNFNCMLILLFMCRNIISLLRSNLDVCCLLDNNAIQIFVFILRFLLYNSFGVTSENLLMDTFLGSHHLSP